jgi:serine protease AprX
LLALAFALVAALLVVAPARHAGAHDHGRDSGWSERDGRQRWGNEFRGWGTVRPVTRRDVRDAVGSDWAEFRGANGQGIDVALIDTGIAPVEGLDDPDLIVNGPDLSLDYQAGVPAGLDTYGHGTHMASIIGGAQGMAEDARLVNVKVGAADGAVDVSQMIAAIDWVVQHRNDPGMNIRVLSLSGGTDSTQSYLVDPLAHAVESAWHHGIVVVAAAGNSGGVLANPAVDPYVLSVGAVDLRVPSTSRDDVVAGFSAVGTPQRGVDVVAPGVSVLGLRVPGSAIDVANPSAVVNGFLFKGSGTSQAAAVVAGAVAQVLSDRPELTPDQVKALLMNTADTLDNSPDASQGAGMIDVLSAVWSRVPRADQSWPVSTGTGSIELSRGGGHLEALDGSILSGEVDLLGAPWVPSKWAPQSAAGTAWDGGTWNGNVWAGAEWLAAGAPGSPLLGHTWRSSTWNGHTWRSDLWLGHTWRGHTWRNGSWD